MAAGENNDERLAEAWEQERKPGLVHLYTGNGKGKTTAALGLALRALGRGRKVAIVQFLKRMRQRKTGELLFAEKMDLPLTIRQFGAASFAPQEVKDWVEQSGQTVQLGWQVALELVAGGQYDLVVLDEITHVVKGGQVALAGLIELIENKPEATELVLTGRYAPPGLIDVCNYVTEMKEIKHPFRDGICAREGTEY